MNVASCMTRAVLAVGPDTSVEAAARLMISNHVGGTPVVDAAGRPVGFLSVKDLVDPDRKHSDAVGQSHGYRLTECKLDPVEAGPVTRPGIVGDVMTRFLLTVSPSIELEEAQRLMIADDLHRVIVVNDGGCIVGILSAMDVLRALAPDHP